MRRLLLALALLAPLPALAQAAGSNTPASGAPSQTSSPLVTDLYALHAQFTFTVQAHPDFHSPYRGANSLDPGPHAAETADITLYAGLRPWPGAELWINSEIDQGFGLSNTLGAAGFPSGEAYKVGARTPYHRIQRIFLRQTIDLSSKREAVESDLNQLSGHRSPDRLVFTLGKVSVGDIFDTSQYAHDPRSDFLNWTVIDTGTFDYAADAWGYTAGTALELYHGRFVARAGAFLLSNVPNSEDIDLRFGQYQLIGELEEGHTLFSHPGKLKLTGFVTHGRQGRFTNAVALAATTGLPVDIVPVRRAADRAGIGLNFQQELRPGLGLFARAGIVDGRYESYEFTDVDRTVSAGVSIGGKPWGRPGDEIGLAGVLNGASRERKAYLAAGGLGILIGDGALRRAGDEHVLETYYDIGLAKGAHLAFDYQLIDTPGYNRDRGPVSFLAMRVHGQF